MAGKKAPAFTVAFAAFGIIGVGASELIYYPYWCLEKGYASFVTTPGANGPRVFRVRVGKFSQRSEAETVARRLEKEEQFKPWITR